MQSVATITEKGGGSKTTLTVSLAALSWAQGFRTAVLDFDGQASARDWGILRENREPTVTRVTAESIGVKMKQLTIDGYDICLIDTPGVASPDISLVMSLADLILIPCRPNLMDLRASYRSYEEATRLGRAARFILSQTTSEIRTSDATAFLDRHSGQWLGGHLSMRVDHADAYARGQGVTEYAPRGTAAREISHIWALVTELLGIARTDQHHVI